MFGVPKTWTGAGRGDPRRSGGKCRLPIMPKVKGWEQIMA